MSHYNNEKGLFVGASVVYLPTGEILEIIHYDEDDYSEKCLYWCAIVKNNFVAVDGDRTFKVGHNCDSSWGIPDEYKGKYICWFNEDELALYEEGYKIEL